MTNVSFLRHDSFFSPADVEDQFINIIGVGATGSWAGLIAAKMGWHNFRIWDLDVVETHNCPNQIYNISQAGKKKVDAFEELLLQFNPNINLEKYDCFFESDKHAHLLDGFVFIAVDSNSARKDIFQATRGNINVSLAIETKMGFNHATMNVYDPFDYKRIDTLINSLIDDSQLQDSACNARIMTTLTNIVASNVAHVFCAVASSISRKNSYTYRKTSIYSIDDCLTIFNA
jgi:hypothetical protein